MPKHTVDKVMDKSVKDTIADIERKYGEGSIMLLGDKEVSDIPAISTTSLSLDTAIGIGGVPRGRIVEIYGPESAGKSTLSLHIVAEAQKAGGTVAYVDSEFALDPEYAKNLGVDIDQLLISQPSSGEEGLEIVEALVRSNQIALIVVDSVASLVPRAEIDGEMGDSLPGLHARLMSQAMRKLTAIIGNSNTCVIFINQIREKIGVMYGCFHYNARVVLEDGTTEKIGKIVNNKLPVKVLTYNEKTKQIESKKILNWFKNGNASYIEQVVVKNPHNSGVSNLPVADSHIIPTPDGEVNSRDLQVGDKVFIRSKKYLNAQQYQLALGMFLGDSGLRNLFNTTAALRTLHGAKQNAYCKWKYSLFSNEFIGSTGTSKAGNFWFDSVRTSELADLCKFKSGGAVKYLTQEIVDRIDLFSLAIWYLDDGNFSGSYAKWGKGKSRIYATKLDESSKQLLASHFEKLGLPKPSIDNRGLIFYGDASYKFQTLIARFVPECMEYKLHPKLRGKFGFKRLPDQKPTECIIATSVLKKYEKPKTRTRVKFDLEIEDNHNYFINDVLVHNSNETTTGGRALKFYSSLRLDIRRIGAIKDGDQIVGNRTKVKVVKNKCAPPFKECEFDIIFSQGISKEGDILDLAVLQNVVSKSGAWYNFGSERIGQGREKSKQFLIDNPYILETIRNEVIDKLKIKK